MVPLEKWTWLVKQKYSPGYKTFEVFSDYVNEPTVGDWRKPITGIVGDDRCGETPVSIPNTEVKTPSAYGTAGFPGGRVGRCRHSIVGVSVMQPLCRGGEIGRHIRLKI